MNLFRLFILLVFTNYCFFFACDSPSTSVMEIENFTFDTLAIERFNKTCSIRAIAAVDEQTLWYGGSGGQFGFTEDGGQTWFTDSLSHPDQSNLAFRSIAVVGNHVFLLSIASPALLYKSSDKGQSWKFVYQEKDSLAFYDALAFWDDKNGIAMGDPTDGCLSIIKTSDGGNNWHKIPCSNLPATAEGEAAFAASNGNIALVGDQVWIVSGGKKSRIFHGEHYGKNWKVYDSPIIQGSQMTGIFSCDFFDKKTGIIMGGDWEKQSQNFSNKAISEDGGKTWNLIADGQAPGYRSSVQFIGTHSADHIIAVGMPGISYSADRGLHWKKLSEESYYTVRKTGKVLWLAGNKKIARWKCQP